MKQKELIKQKVKSVSRVLALLLMCYMLYFESQAQSDQKLTKEQYQVIEGAFKNSGLEYTRIFFQTIDYKSWVHLLYGTYYRQKGGIGLCSFEDPQLKNSIDQLIDHVTNIRVKEFSQNKLGKRFVLIQDLEEYPYLSITEPIIIGDYSFILFKYTNSESLKVQKKNKEGDWIYECSIPLYVVLID